MHGTACGESEISSFPTQPVRLDNRSAAVWVRAAAAAALTAARATAPPSPPPPPPPPLTCSGAPYAFDDDSLGTYFVGYKSLPADYGGGALNWTNWNVINGTLWGLGARLNRILNPFAALKS